MQDDAPLHLRDLVLKPLGHKGLSGLSRMLRCIAESVNAFGCILWQVAPHARLNRKAPSGRLFVLAEWFAGNKRDVMHDLPLDKSVTGNAIWKNRFRRVVKTKRTEPVFIDDPFLIENDIKAFCSIPISFLDGTKGAVNLYRIPSQPFSQSDREQIELLASLVPSIYGAIRDKVSYNLIGAVNKIFEEQFRAADEQSPDYFDKVQIKEVLRKICDTVTDSFQCIETSIFLEDPLEAPGKYEMMATTWPWLKHFNKSTYRKGDNGLTGWVLSNAKPVKIFDLEYFERDKRAIRSEYRGLRWMDSLNVKSDEARSAIRSQLKLKPDDKLPPFSFMAVPIAKGKDVQGVIRCCIAAKGPNYFAERELELLTLVAAQISRYWSHREEIDAWQALVRSVGKMNDFVYDELTKEKPEENRIFTQALQMTSKVIKGSDIMDVRLYDEKKRELYFANPEDYLFGPFLDAWNQGTVEEILRRRNMTFSVEGNAPDSIGAYVFKTGKVYLTHDVRNDPYYRCVFPDTKRKIVAPMSIKDKFYGALDIRGTGECPFPGRAGVMADLVGRQLGLYLYLGTTVRALRQTQTELRENLMRLRTLQNIQIKAFENLDHQLKSPLIPALVRIQAALKGAAPNSKIESDLLAIRGLVRKTRQVSLNTRLFIDLAREKEIRLTTSSLKADSFIKTLIEAASDNRLMIDPSRNIRFRVDRESFEMLRTLQVRVDHDLLAQAVMNILDNAGKYSFGGSEVRIQGGLTKTGRFQITIVNKGLPIRLEDVQLCKERGWRSGLAELTTGEGGGIGLWIVDNIMKAHRGELIINPTVEKVTRVQLVFPVSQ